MALCVDKREKKESTIGIECREWGPSQAIRSVEECDHCAGNSERNKAELASVIL